MQVQLGGSDWAEIKEQADLRRKDRKEVNKAIRFEYQDGEPIVSGSLQDDMEDAVLKNVVTNWSLQFPLPSVDPKSLDKLTLDQDDKLREAVQPLLAALRGKNAPVEENEDPTEDSAS